VSIRKFVATVTLAVGLGTAAPAHAWMQFCNGTSAAIWTTYEWYAPSCASEDGSVWQKRGWWSLNPGECKIVYGGSLPSRYSYYYAEGGGRVWAGQYFTCTPSSGFDWCDNTCSTNSRNLGWRELDTGSASNYTLTFTP
jgi:uncharacterized membrane protein